MGDLNGLDQKAEVTSSVLEMMSRKNHEEVAFCYDEETGLKAIIAIHNTVLGPSLGGTRMWPYQSEQEALRDVLRLSRGMTYKSSIAGLKLGGGKAVIIGDSRKDKSEKLFRRFGKFVDSLGGRYITAEDVGISPKEIQIVKQQTKHAVGLPEEMGGGGDPSPMTAYGVYMGMKAAAKEKYGSDDLTGKVIAVQGVGHVGAALVDHLIVENAKVVVSDVHEASIVALKEKHPQLLTVGPQEIYDLEMDIYAPCALGGTINSETLNRLKCVIIAGAANNQLEREDEHGTELMEKGMLYAPDFLINAGGIINCYSEYHGYNRQEVLENIEKIYDTTLSIFEKSKRENIPTYLAANQIAEQRITASLAT